MSNAQGHLIAGTLVSLALAFVLYKFVHVSFTVTLMGIMLGVIASEFPDVDHPHALPRKIMRGIMPALIIATFAYLFFAWNIISSGILIISLFVAMPIIIIASYEYFIPKHRGATHKWPGLLFVAVAAVPLGFAVGQGIVTTLILVTFVTIGFSTHILLDHL